MTEIERKRTAIKNVDSNVRLLVIAMPVGEGKAHAEVIYPGNEASFTGPGLVCAKRKLQRTH